MKNMREILKDYEIYDTDDLNEIAASLQALLIEEIEKLKFFDNPYVEISKYARQQGEARNQALSDAIECVRRVCK